MIKETRTFDGEEQTLLARFEELGMINKSLCLLTETKTGMRLLIIVPRIQRSTIITDYHSGHEGGDFAFNKTRMKN